MKGIISSARTADATTRQSLTSQFSDLAKQINTSVADSSYQGLNLADNSSASLTVHFNAENTATLTITAKNMKASKLMTTMGTGVSNGTTLVANMLQAGGGTGVNGFSSLTSQASLSPASVLDHMSAIVDKAISSIRSQSSLLGGNVTFLTARLSFSNEYANTLTDGSAKLVSADLNAEGANLVSLQTRAQIGIQSLSIAGQQQQSILSLLR